MRKKTNKRRHALKQVVGSNPIPEPNPDEESHIPEIVIDFTLRPTISREGNFLGEQEDSDAHTFHVHTTMEEAYSAIPWQRMAEIISPFVIRILGEGLEKVRPEDIKPDHVLMSTAKLFGVADDDRASAENEETGFSFHGFAMLRYSIKTGEARGMTTVDVTFFDGSSNGANFVFEERL